MERMVGPAVQLRTLLTPDHLRAMQQAVAESYIDPRVSAYAATLVQATRYPANHGLEAFAPAIAFGGSPRASINLVLGARALAFLRGRRYALPQDVAELFGDVLRHRLVLSYEGLASGVTPEAIIGAALARYPAPRIDLGDRHVG
jgi:MoxR-like ATPase